MEGYVDGERGERHSVTSVAGGTSMRRFRWSTAPPTEMATSFACLYDRYRRTVWELSYYLCQRDHHDAEEAMQATFLKAWRSLRRYRGAGTFKSWLLAICRNVCIDRVHRAPEKQLALERCAGGQIADRVPRSGPVDAIVLGSTLAALPCDEREAWFLVDVQGCTSEEAALIVGTRAASTVAPASPVRAPSSSMRSATRAAGGPPTPRGAVGDRRDEPPVMVSLEPKVEQRAVSAPNGRTSRR